MTRWLVRWLAAIVLPTTMVALPGCGEGAGEPPTMVFAAASLAAPFQALASEFEKAHAGSRVDLHFAGTPQLVLQLREGAPADVFASADEPNMAKVTALGRVVGAPQRFARNRLAIVVMPDNPMSIAGLADLGRGDLEVALCGPDVPAGRYAREALAKAGVVVSSVSDEASVKAVVTLVELGEVDAGIVYATDCRGLAVAAVAIPEAHQVYADYPIAVLDSGRNRARGEAFVQFVRSAAGLRILESFGFLSP